MSFEDDIVPFEKSNTGINMCVYGNNGIGKTPFIATSPNVLILQADPGGVTSAKAASRPGHFVPIESWKTMEEAEDYFRNDAKAKRFKWVWLDSLSVWSSVGGLEDIMVQLIKPASEGGGGRSHRKVYLPDKGEYGENMNRIKLLVKHFCQMPVNFGFTATAEQFEDPNTGEITYMPWIQGKNMPPTICGMMDIIAYMKIVKDEQVAFFRTRENFYARDRTGALPPFMKSPTIPKIEALINGASPAKRTAGRRPVKKAPARRRPA